MEHFEQQGSIFSLNGLLDKVRDALLFCFNLNIVGGTGSRFRERGGKGFTYTLLEVAGAGRIKL